MRAVVTGGAGFLGSHLSDKLLAEGWEVVAIDNFITGQPANIAHLSNTPGFTFIEQDVCEPLQIEGPVDFVFHFASPASPDDFTRVPIEVLRVGSLGTFNTLELAKEKRAKFMIASTSEVYGDPLISPQPESYWGNVNSIGIRSVYDESKRFSEAATMAYHRYHGVDTRIVRFFNTYGPRMRLDDGRVVPNFVKQALLNEPITIYGDGKQTRSFGYYSDTIQGVYLLAQSNENGPVNIGTDQERTILEFAEAVLAAVGSQSPIIHLPAAQDDPKQRKPDLTRARTILGYEIETDFQDGLRQTIEYFKTQVDFSKKQ